MAKVEDFFSSSNAVQGIDEAIYQHLDNLKYAVDAMSNATYQSIYIIDYLKREFLHVAQNPLFLCGHSAEQVRQMGYRFYIEHVPAEEQEMLTELNEAGFRKFNEMPIEQKRGCYMSYDFHIIGDNGHYLVNHKGSPAKTCVIV